MVNLHNIVGTLVVLAFLVLAVVNALRVMGREIGWIRPLSFVAAALLLVQYVIGFGLLGQGHPISSIHYITALLAIVTVGLEHGYARTRASPGARARAALVASGLTFVLVLIAYIIGSSR